MINNNLRGRPTKYNAELQDKFDKLVLNIYLGDVKSLWINYWNYGIVEQIALYLGLYSTETIYSWSNPQSSDYQEDFANTFKAWKIVTKSLLHKLTPMLAKNAPALAIFLRKVKLGELEVSKHIHEGRIETKDSVEIRIIQEIQEAERLGIDKADIEEVKGLLNELKLLPVPKMDNVIKKKKDKMRIRPKRPIKKRDKEEIKNSVVPDENLGLDVKANNY